MGEKVSFCSNCGADVGGCGVGDEVGGDAVVEGDAAGGRVGGGVVSLTMSN